ncbi:hypothetical protein [Nostoc commune]|nr:hypothetical protein [Nostoc commune]
MGNTSPWLKNLPIEYKFLFSADALAVEEVRWLTAIAIGSMWLS